MKTKFQSHDLTLPAWGPYTKQYSGISHIPRQNNGVRFDLAVFPGYYRRRVDVPNVNFESGYHMWNARPDLSRYTIRHEMEWKDQVYADISFAQAGPDTSLIRAECCNDTDQPQNLVLHWMASLHLPSPSYTNFEVTGADISLPAGAALAWACDHEDLRFAVPRPRDGLAMDGLRRGEEPVEGFVTGYGVGQGFGGRGGVGRFGQVIPNGKGDKVWYKLQLEKPLAAPCLVVRYLNAGDEAGLLTLPGGEELALPCCTRPGLARVELKTPLAAGEVTLELTGGGAGDAKLDCLVLCEAADADKVSIQPRQPAPRPEMELLEQERILLLKYRDAEEYYGLVWQDCDWQLRQIENDELDIFLRYTVHDHVNAVLRGNGKGHFTNLFIRPIPLRPGQHRCIYGAVCSAASRQQALEHCRQLATLDWAGRWKMEDAADSPDRLLPEGEPYRLGQRLMRTTLLTNVVYPVYTRGQYIRHNTPGRWWDCLYTWDSGMIGMGLATADLRRAYDCLNAYLTPEGDDEAAFIFHGSLVPTQFYLFGELLNRTGSLELARDCYPRLLQYYRFYTGRAGGSTTANLASGLLRPWDYFYNSGGWDDYPPQKELHVRRLEASCTPVVNTSHAIRCARLLAYTAGLLGKEEDKAQLLADAENFTRALQQSAWDQEAGYFGYVLHDEAGKPCGFLRHQSGENYNMGLDGASPLFAGACTPAQQLLLWERLADENRLWCRCGLSTVDQSAPYYRKDGYWNGAVWMPYQWFFYKAALDAGRGEFAWRIAHTALELWREETERSYNCFEHFMIESGRGAGWHQFGGLSAPVTQWFASYYRPGTVTTGFDTYLQKADWKVQAGGVALELFATRPGKTTVVAVLEGKGPWKAEAAVPVQVNQRLSGCVELTLEVAEPGAVTCRILPR